MNADWEHFDHGAAIGVHGLGATKAAAIEQAAQGIVVRWPSWCGLAGLRDGPIAVSQSLRPPSG